MKTLSKLVIFALMAIAAVQIYRSASNAQKASHTQLAEVIAASE